MKIIRYVDSQGAIKYGSPQADGQVLELVGEPFDRLILTEKPARVVKWLAPLAPTSILCIGLNYRQHAAETNAKVPDFPVLFMKSPGAVQNPRDPILLPRHLRSEQVDYEAELAVVIGRAAKNVSRASALDYVWGYTCANDVSARDWQRDWGGSQWCRGKTFDTFCPLGPVLVTADEITNPNTLKLKSLLNGRVMQDSNTRDMIFDVPTLIEFLSGSTTLLPGTVILTGTPQGVGMARKPPLWLRAGDQITIEIERIGALMNPVAEEG